MKKIIISFFITCSCFCNAQNVNIPDTKFKQALISRIDINNDKEIQLNEALATDSLYLEAHEIYDLTGIEAFTELTYLNCARNRFTSLDVSKNTKLTLLYCFDNNLSNLDISKNTKLTSLACYNNNLPYLSISNNIHLKFLRCNFIEQTSLNLMNHKDLLTVAIYGSPKLSTICVNEIPTTFNLELGDQNKLSTRCITSLLETENKKKTVLKAYNLQGKEVSTDTKGEVIFLLYSDGSKEKVMVQE